SRSGRRARSARRPPRRGSSAARRDRSLNRRSCAKIGGKRRKLPASGEPIRPNAMRADRKVPLGLGEAAPWFHCPTLGGKGTYAFDTAAGRAILLLFFGTPANEKARAALNAVAARRALFDDEKAAFFGI